MKIAICDNDPLFTESFRNQLTEALHTKSTHAYIHVYEELPPLLEECAGGADIIFMDIEWENSLNGIDIAEALYERNMAAKIVYVTGHIDQYVQQIYLKNTNICGILTKPVAVDVLKQLLDKIMIDVNSTRKEDFVIHQNGQAIRLTQSQVIYMESKNHVLEIVTRDQIYRLYQPLQALLPLLPDCFIRCHRSYVVNMNKIQSLGRQELILENGMKVPIGRMYGNKVKESFVEWISREI